MPYAPKNLHVMQLEKQLESLRTHTNVGLLLVGVISSCWGAMAYTGGTWAAYALMFLVGWFTNKLVRVWTMVHLTKYEIEQLLAQAEEDEARIAASKTHNKSGVSDEERPHAIAVYTAEQFAARQLRNSSAFTSSTFGSRADVVRWLDRNDYPTTDEFVDAVRAEIKDVLDSD